MTLLSENYIRSKSNNTIDLLEESFKFDEKLTYDAFISHSYSDKNMIKGLYNIFNELELRVYIDWIDDSNLDRSKVNKETAQLLKERMKKCKSLIYVFSKNTEKSRWCPWELGLADGLHEKSMYIKNR